MKRKKNNYIQRIIRITNAFSFLRGILVFFLFKKKIKIIDYILAILIMFYNSVLRRALTVFPFYILRFHNNRLKKKITAFLFFHSIIKKYRQ